MSSTSLFDDASIINLSKRNRTFFKMLPSDTLKRVVLCFSTLASLSLNDFCSPKTCYEVLNVDRDADQKTIKKAFYRLAVKAHPDINRDPNAVELFLPITNAYQILMKNRQEYDTYLYNYEKNLKKTYLRYKLKMLFDIKVVVVFLAVVFSAIQHYLSEYNYNQALNKFMQMPKFKNQALRFVYNTNYENDGKKKTHNITITEECLRNYIESCPEFYLNYPKVLWAQTLVGQIVMFPYNLTVDMLIFLKYSIKCKVLKYPLNYRDKIYLTYKTLNMSRNTFFALRKNAIDNYLDLELWIPENNLKYFESLTVEESRKPLSGKEKAFLRYMKRGGYGKITFED